MTLKNLPTIALFLGVTIGVLTGQEMPEIPPEAEITEETDATTTDTTPRIVPAKDLDELARAQVILSNAEAVVNHILTRIITEYQINVQEEVLNIKTGRITLRDGN